MSFDFVSLGKFFLSDKISNLIDHNLVLNQSLPSLSLESIFEVLIDLQLSFILLFGVIYSVRIELVRLGRLSKLQLAVFKH